MKLASIRKFRSSLSGYTKKRDMIIITSYGKMVGCFLPLTDTSEIPMELKKEFVSDLGKKISSQLSSQKTQEKEILDDFKEFKKSSRR